MAAGSRLQPMDCTILLVRHAHVEMAGRFCGSSDPPLSGQGREQSAKLVQELSKYRLTHIFSSDRLRAQETAKYIGARACLRIELLPSLCEMHFGTWEGLNWDEVTGLDQPFAARWMTEYPLLAAPGGEAFIHFRERVRNALTEVAARTGGGCAAVVTHGGVIRTLMLDFMRLPERQLAAIPCDYACYFELQMKSGEWIVRTASGLHEVQTNSQHAVDSD